MKNIRAIFELLLKQLQQEQALVLKKEVIKRIVEYHKHRAPLTVIAYHESRVSHLEPVKVLASRNGDVLFCSANGFRLFEGKAGSTAYNPRRVKDMMVLPFDPSLDMDFEFILSMLESPVISPSSVVLLPDGIFVFRYTSYLQLQDYREQRAFHHNVAVEGDTFEAALPAFMIWLRTQPEHHFTDIYVASWQTIDFIRIDSRDGIWKPQLMRGEGLNVHLPKGIKL